MARNKSSSTLTMDSRTWLYATYSILVSVRPEMPFTVSSLDTSLPCSSTYVSVYVYPSRNSAKVRVPIATNALSSVSCTSSWPS